jgi:hypothetical protein
VKLSGLPHATEEIFELKPIGSFEIEEGLEIRLAMSDEAIVVRASGIAALCEMPQDTTAERLRGIVESVPYIAELLRGRHPAVIRVLTYHDLDRWSAVRTIGIDDQLVEAVNRRRVDGPRDVGAVVDWLSDDVSIPGDEPRLILSVGGSEVASFEAFRILGQTRAVDVRVVDDRLLVERVVERRRGDQGHLHLVYGAVSFVDATRVGRLAPIEAAELRMLAQEYGAYLAIWNEYSKVERELHEQAVRSIVWVEYDDRRRLDDGRWEFDLVRSSRADLLLGLVAKGSIPLEAGEAVPFEGPAGVRRRPSSGGVAGAAAVAPGGRIVIAPAFEPRRDRSIPPRGFVFGSWTADSVRLARRDEAAIRAVNSRAFPVVQLSRILVHRPLAPAGRHKRHHPLSARTQSALGARPTDAQTAAIDAALNTPDIALIQGPPGTGKTRVIAAIQARLAEISAEAPAGPNRVLLSSYQQDAVSNVVLAARDGRLPPVKVGRRMGVLDDDHILQWAGDLAEKLDERYAGTPVARLVRLWLTLVDRWHAYTLTPPDLAGTVELLDWLSIEARELVGAPIAADAQDLSMTLGQQLAAQRNPRALDEIARRARSLRTSYESFLDDGPEMARAAHGYPPLYEALDTFHRDVLETASTTRAPTPQLLASLASVQTTVIDRVVLAKARTRAVGAMPEVMALLERATRESDDRLRGEVEQTHIIVEEFRRDILEQPAAVQEAIRNHTAALAATCQQAVSKAMYEAQLDNHQFDTVIIDEAARANPLDLMIPMTLANRRIILVGDHRQLPQMLDEEILRKLSDKHSANAVEEVLSRSLFERLFVRLRELELADGVRRAVTLDRQFRTHPVLGEFINSQFYEPFGEGLSNGNPDPGAFAHGLSKFGTAACAWVDVPHSRGGESGGNSKSRAIEAQVTVAELDEALRASEHLTFGVITFYKGQEQALWEAMVDRRLAVHDQGGEFSLASSVDRLWTHHGLPRVRIGTVDAFQGREFDVVFLSLTRSTRSIVDFSGSATRRFGFLTLANRLCVAMSRQKRLLVAVGDAEMFSSDGAHAAVPALFAFYGLTGGPFGCRRSS